MKGFSMIKLVAHACKQVNTYTSHGLLSHNYLYFPLLTLTRGTTTTLNLKIIPFVLTNTNGLVLQHPPSETSVSQRPEKGLVGYSSQVPLFSFKGIEYMASQHH